MDTIPVWIIWTKKLEEACCLRVFRVSVWTVSTEKRTASVRCFKLVLLSLYVIQHATKMASITSTLRNLHTCSTSHLDHFSFSKSWPCQSLQCGCFQTCMIVFLSQSRHKQTFKTPDIIISVFPYSLLRLIGMVGEACLPSNAYLRPVPPYLCLVHVCLSEHSLFCRCVYRLPEIWIWYDDLRFILNTSIHYENTPIQIHC